MDQIRYDKVISEAVAYIKRGWLIGAYAENERYESVSPYDEDACRFCMSGALMRAAHQFSVPAASVFEIVGYEVRKYFKTECGAVPRIRPGMLDTIDGDLLIHYNDNFAKTEVDVINMLEAARPQL